MDPFVKLNIPVRRQFATVEQLQGPQSTTYVGTVYPYDIKNGYKLFTPDVWRLLQPDVFSLIRIYTSVGPHIDIKATARLNVYIEANGATTTFYRTLPHTKPYVVPYHGTDAASMYHEHELEYDSSFTAQLWDTYLLNTKIPHSVNATASTRSFVQFSWNTRPYEDIATICLEHFNEPVL